MYDENYHRSNQARRVSPFYVSPIERLSRVFSWLGLVPLVIIFGWAAWRLLCR